MSSYFIYFSQLTAWDVGCQPSRQDRKGSLQKKGKGETACFANIAKVLEDRRENIVDEIHKEEVDGSQDSSPTVDLPTELTEFANEKLLAAAGPVPPKIDSIKHIPLWSPSYRG